MISIIESSYTEGPLQQDGRRQVTLYCLDSDGITHKHSWLGSEDVHLALQEYLTRIETLLIAKSAAREAVSSARLSMSKWEFRQLFGSKRELIDEFNETYASNENLSPAQKRTIRTGLEDYKASRAIDVPFLPSVRNMVALYQAVGILTSEEAAEVLANG